MSKFLSSFFAIGYMLYFFTAQRIVLVIFRAAVVRQLVAHLNLLCRVISLLSFICTYSIDPSLTYLHTVVVCSDLFHLALQWT